MSKIVLYIATSSDGFIADKNGGVDWLPQPKNEADLEAVGYNKLMNRIDTILMGRKSYDQIKTFGQWGWPGKQTYVFTSRSIDGLPDFISTTKLTPVEFSSNAAKDTWLLGGAQLAQSYDKAGLIDEIILTITPHLLNDGIALGVNLDNYELVSSKDLMDGMIQKTYVKISQEK